MRLEHLKCSWRRFIKPKFKLSEKYQIGSRRIVPFVLQRVSEVHVKSLARSSPHCHSRDIRVPHLADCADWHPQPFISQSSIITHGSYRATKSNQEICRLQKPRLETWCWLRPTLGRQSKGMYMYVEITSKDRVSADIAHRQFPRSAIKNLSTFQNSDTKTFCPWKGEAEYYSVKTGGMSKGHFSYQGVSTNALS